MEIQAVFQYFHVFYVVQQYGNPTSNYYRSRQDGYTATCLYYNINSHKLHHIHIQKEKI